MLPSSLLSRDFHRSGQPVHSPGCQHCIPSNSHWLLFVLLLGQGRIFKRDFCIFSSPIVSCNFVFSFSTTTQPSVLKYEDYLGNLTVENSYMIYFSKKKPKNQSNLNWYMKDVIRAFGVKLLWSQLLREVWHWKKVRDLICLKPHSGPLCLKMRYKCCLMWMSVR